MTIFVSVASYRDPLLGTTIKSAMDNAEYPDNVKFGIVYQGTEREKPDLSSFKNYSIISMHPKEARGAGYARHLAMRLYAGEDYYLQIDSHTIFAKHWDTMLIDQLKLAQDKASNEKVVLSAFPPPFIYQNNKRIVIPIDNVAQATYPTKQVPSRNKRGEWTAVRVDFDDPLMETPEESKTILAGMLFAPGNFVFDVPYDPEISFFGEEICIAMRAWTRGWDIYSPSKIALYHFYLRGGFPKIWKDRNLRNLSWKELETISKKKQARVLTGQEHGVFGVGQVRSLQDFEKFIGIDFSEVYGGYND